MGAERTLGAPGRAQGVEDEPSCRDGCNGISLIEVRRNLDNILRPTHTRISRRRFYGFISIGKAQIRMIPI